MFLCSRHFKINSRADKSLETHFLKKNIPKVFCQPYCNFANHIKVINQFSKKAITKNVTREYVQK